MKSDTKCFPRLKYPHSSISLLMGQTVRQLSSKQHFKASRKKRSFRKDDPDAYGHLLPALKPLGCGQSLLPTPSRAWESVFYSLLETRVSKHPKPTFHSQCFSLAVLNKEKKIIIMPNILFMEEKIAVEYCHIVWSIFNFIPESWK